MNWRTILMVGGATGLLATASWAQAIEDNPNPSVPRQIREKLTADGFEDIKMTPGSYIVSARDKDGHRVVMLISPTHTTVMKIPDNPSQAQMPDPKDQIIQQ